LTFRFTKKEINMFNRKNLISATFVACASIAIFGCSAFFDPCAGQVDCGGGNCAPAGSVCCSETTYCASGEVCGPGNTCLGGGVSGCLASGEQTCHNNDGTTDCAPLLATCCGNHTYCAYPYPVCSGGGCVQ
jgi:hypothetical protein